MAIMAKVSKVLRKKAIILVKKNIATFVAMTSQKVNAANLNQRKNIFTSILIL